MKAIKYWRALMWITLVVCILVTVFHFIPMLISAKSYSGVIAGLWALIVIAVGVFVFLYNKAVITHNKQRRRKRK